MAHLNENKGPNENIGGFNVPLKGSHVCLISQLFQKVPHALHANIIAVFVDSLAGLGQGALVLRLQNHVGHLSKIL